MNESFNDRKNEITHFEIACYVAKQFNLKCYQSPKSESSYIVIEDGDLKIFDARISGHTLLFPKKNEYILKYDHTYDGWMLEEEECLCDFHDIECLYNCDYTTDIDFLISLIIKDLEYQLKNSWAYDQ